MLTLVTSSTADWRMELPDAAARRRSVPPTGSNPVPSRASCTVPFSMLEGVTASIQEKYGTQYTHIGAVRSGYAMIYALDTLSVVHGLVTVLHNL